MHPSHALNPGVHSYSIAKVSPTDSSSKRVDFTPGFFYVWFNLIIGWALMKHNEDKFQKLWRRVYTSPNYAWFERRMAEIKDEQKKQIQKERQKWSCQKKDPSRS